MKSVVATLGAAALAIAGAAVATPAFAEKWDMPMAYSDQNFHTQNGKKFAECVKTATGGEIDITVHGGGSLFKGNEIKRAVQTGQAQIGERLLSAHQNENPLFGADSIPFMATSYEDAEKFYGVLKPKLEEILAKQNLVLLYSVPWPPQGLYFKKEVTSIADMKGLKFRSYNAATAKMAELAGMLPVQIEAAELSQALATGVAESFISSGATGYDRKVWEHLTHFYSVNAWLPRNHVFVNKQVWDGVSDKNKAAIRGCADLAAYSGLWRSIQYTDFTLNGLRAGGMTVGPAGEQLVSDLKKIGETMAADWLKAAGPEGEALIKAYQAQ